MRTLFSVFVLCLSAGCGDETKNKAWPWDLPPSFPQPRIPEDNQATVEKAELGRHLFFDTQLSGNASQSCASCHQPALAFTDGLRVSEGSTGELTPRSSMSLANVAYAATFTWANSLLRSLKGQALIPMFGEDPVELGLAGKEDLLAERLAQSTDYPILFREAYPDAAEHFTVDQVVQALATFQRRLISGNAPYDQYIHGDDAALSASAKRGLDLFFSERLECFHCHGGFNFSDAVDHDGNVFDQAAFHNNGLYNVDDRGGYPASDRGLIDVTQEPSDMGKFKAPTLRNIALTAPYMHDGSIDTLEAVIDHYAAGGRNITEGEHVGDGRLNPFKSGFVSGFELTESEKEDVLAFLEALTDESFIENPDFQAP